MTILRLLRSSLLSFLLAVPAHAAQIELAWDPNTETDLAGYRIYYATFSLLHESTTTARNNPNIAIWEVGQTTTTLTPLLGGTTYYFRATAFDISRNESGFNVKLSSGGFVDDEVVALIKRSDLNGDGHVDILDLGILAKEGDW